MIREAKADEALKVVSFLKQFEQASQFVKVDVDHASKQFARLINSGNGVVFIMENSKGELQGGIGAIALPDLNCGVMTAVETFWFVAPEHRGGGMRLMEAFERWGKDKGCKRLAMIHLVDSYPDILEKIYINEGYKLVEKHYVKEVSI